MSLARIADLLERAVDTYEQHVDVLTFRAMHEARSAYPEHREVRERFAERLARRVARRCGVPVEPPRAPPYR